MIKRFAAIICVLVLTLSMTATAAFSDVNSSSPEGQAISKLEELGVIGGFPDGTFKPSDALTREQFVKILYMLKSTDAAPTASETGFFDVAADRWSAGYIKWAADQRIVGGMGDGTFSPALTVTIGQAAKMLCTAYGMPDTLAFPQGYIEAAQAEGYFKDMSGYQAGDQAKRSQICLMAYNAYMAQPQKPAEMGIITAFDGASITLAAADENGRGTIASSKTDYVSPTDPIKGVWVYYAIDDSTKKTISLSPKCAVQIIEGKAGTKAKAVPGTFSDIKPSTDKEFYSAQYVISGGNIISLTLYRQPADVSHYETYTSLVAIPLTIPLNINPGATGIVNIWYGPQANPRDLDFGLTGLTQPKVGRIDYAATHPASFWNLRYTQAKDAKVGDVATFTYTLTTRDGKINATGVVNVKLVAPTIVPDKTIVVEPSSETVIDTDFLKQGIIYAEGAPNPNVPPSIYAYNPETKAILQSGDVLTSQGGRVSRRTGSLIIYKAPENECEDSFVLALHDGWDYSYFTIHVNVLK